MIVLYSETSGKQKHMMEGLKGGFLNDVKGEYEDTSNVQLWCANHKKTVAQEVLEKFLDKYFG